MLKISTPYQSQYIAWLLSRRMGADSADLLASTLADAQVDLNPHQVEAALFAFQSPLSRGVILADEVGLGKTIEAGLVIAQRWAERKRHILIITPANLRKQWHQELQDKFSLQALILEAKSYKEIVKGGNKQPFEQASRVFICSYQFAKTRADDLRRVPWNLVVMDEAHRLRNVYKPSNVIGKALKDALPDAFKVLLTATPLQNSLLELYGLVSMVDERVFGDLPSFRDQFGALGNPDTVAKLRARMQHICMRTLRRQVQPYISYTRRIPMVEPFTPSQDEKLGANKKALIFTESRRTQDYLLKLLEQSAYAGQTILFNGSNSSGQATCIYHAWLKRHTGTDRITGSRTADTTNLPQKCRDHFNGLREAKPDLVGIALFDRLERALQPNEKLNEIMWSKREIENYFCTPEVLSGWAVHDVADDLFGIAERATRQRAMEKVIVDVTHFLEIDEKSPWSSDVKATDEVLDRIFRVFFKEINLPLSFRKRDYHLLAGFLSKQQIDQEVVEKLDAIVEVASRAKPVKA